MYISKKNLSEMGNHTVHLVDVSPWPLVVSVATGCLTLNISYWFKSNSLSPTSMKSTIMAMIIIPMMWWRDVLKEASSEGSHTNLVSSGIRWGFILFVMSEVMLFFSLFWAFFHSSLNPGSDVGQMYPPMNIMILDPASVPFLNTTVLLSSGATITWSHHAIMEGKHATSKLGLIFTLVLAFYFTFLQYTEYLEAAFTINDGAYGSTFFSLTGTHGLHVIVGSIFLLVCLVRLNQGMMSPTHHAGYEYAIWYWHFVDVVWVYLFFTIYIWGGK